MPAERPTDELIAALHSESGMELADMEAIAERLGWSCEFLPPEAAADTVRRLRADTRVGSITISPAEVERVAAELRGGGERLVVFEKRWDAGGQTEAAVKAEAVGRCLREGLSEFPGPHLYAASNLDDEVVVTIISQMRNPSPAPMGGMALAETALQDPTVPLAA